MSHMITRDARAYGTQLRQLLPRGAAWDVPEGSTFDNLCVALGEEFARIDARAIDLLEEADPRTALEMLADWERIAALPDACTGAPDNVSERQVALHHKLTRVGSQSRSGYAELAARVGYQVWIEEHRPARSGEGRGALRIGDRLNSQDWGFVWTVHVRPYDGFFTENSFVAVARIGDRIGVRLRGFGALDVECLIRRAAPAHTLVQFAYDIEPVPVFWINFTQ